MYFHDSLSWSKSELEQTQLQPGAYYSPTQSLSDGETVQRANQKINGYKTEITELKRKKSNSILLTQLPKPVYSGTGEAPAADAIIPHPHTAETCGWAMGGSSAQAPLLGTRS